MRLNRNSLWLRLFLPIFTVIIAVSMLMLFVAHRINEEVQDDYHKFIESAAGNDIASLLSAAASDLTAYTLIDNQVVVEAKQKSVAEAIKLSMERLDHGVVIYDSATGKAVVSSVEDKVAEQLAGGHEEGFFTANVDGRKTYCYAVLFPLWNWRVVAVNKHADFTLAGRNIQMLLPAIAIAFMIMTAALYMMLQRILNRPVQAMVVQVSGKKCVEAVGISELDMIGQAVNESFTQLIERSIELEQELQQRKSAEAALSLRDEQVRMLMESTIEGIYGVDLDGVCTYCNPSALKMLGYETEDALIGKEIHSLIHHTYPNGEPYPSDKCNAYRAFRMREAVYIKGEVFWRRDATSFPVEYWSYPLMRGQEIKGAIVTFVDVSERNKLEQQLIQSQKMEAVGHLAGGVAHDFNNLLTAIIGYAEIMQAALEKDSTVRPYVEQVLLAGNKAAELTQALLAFSRKQVLNPKAVDINGIIRNIHKIIKRLIGEDIVFTVKYHAEPLVVMADSNQIDQVLLNLATNARDAMPNGGTLSIETLIYRSEGPGSQADAPLPAGNYACICVSDTGAGMDKNIKKQIFEPFFTTKDFGRGTGLGLSIVFGIIKQHGGFISVYSEPDQGSVFKVYLPVVNEEETVEVQKPVYDGRGETLLLVEDDELVRNMLIIMLDKRGYKVIAAQDGKTALSLLESPDAHVDLVLMDIIMPNMNGKQVYERIREMGSDIKVIFMSGYTGDIIQRKGLLDENMNFIPKPIKIYDLLRMIHSLLKK